MKNLKTNLEKAYNKSAQERNSASIQAWKIEERSRFLSLLITEKKENLLEIGAGPGKDSRFFQENGLKVLCTDLSPEMVKLCRQKGLDARVMDFSELQIPEKSFDAVYAMNSLLQLPKKELPAVLQTVNAILKRDGLFFIGVYGGIDHEGIWEEDNCEPKRFFSFYDDEHLKRILGEVFDLLSFRQINTGESSRHLHFQSITLRKR
ncbi:MAG: class I SAM-dependent methyltransferase [Anaerolineales bacterium]|uniref:Class I SAM-dependent methyltransferase n=1 Tax=Candidatus Desulfolinea nitratireducens TaxID=2841698 RepID=A0A8J6TGY1_9CHLR|nr:class I SAM-dependent methyltransferase [Candidatus Desulfolinea nitratireducens]MBL6961119.1 class I SAM-dependent methyltransferase [Anaerolineales bacterium]